MKQKEKLLFELSYLNTSALLAIRDRMSFVQFPERVGDAWQNMLMKSSARLRK